MEWMPIETAPGDFVEVLVAVPAGRPNEFVIMVAYKDGNGEWWGSPGNELLDAKPTKWQPLPAPPVTPSAEPQPTSPASADSSR